MSIKPWHEVKERYDSLNTKKGTYPSEKYDYYQIPTIKKTPHKIPKKLTPFTRKPHNTYTHFYLDDYQFERVWNTPKKYIEILKQYQGVLSPDFSLYTDYPRAVQIWNTYRNRWCGRYWQTHGISVIPTVGWSDRNSFEFCFQGLEEGSIVSISTVGVLNDKEAIKNFKEGYKALLTHIEPEHILFYGDIVPGLDLEDVPITFYENFTTTTFGKYVKKE